MTIKISNKTTKSQIEKAVSKFSKEKKTKGFDARKYFGKLVRNVDGLDYQKSLRNEWN
jgi:hypothetical protein